MLEDWKSLSVKLTGEFHFLCSCLYLFTFFSVLLTYSLKIHSLLFWPTLYIYIPYILVYKPAIFGWILTLKLWGSSYIHAVLPARISIQHHGYLSAMLTVFPLVAWTISRPLDLHRCIGECAAAGFLKTTHKLLPLCCIACNFVADFRLWLVLESLIFARSSVMGMVDGLYTNVYGIHIFLLMFGNKCVYSVE